MIQETPGKLTARDKKLANFLYWIPWIAFPLIALPFPVVFFLLFLGSAATDAAAVYLLLAVIGLALGCFAGALVMILLFLYRKRWLRRLRNKLAEDGITASEVIWFTSELSTAERKTLLETGKHSLLLADAYRETLASRLTASRILAKSNQELVRVRSRITRARSLAGADTATLLLDLESDQRQLESLKTEAKDRLAEARARLQTIEAAASRSLNQAETHAMLRRLSATQEHLPLVIEMDELERKTLREAERDLKELESPVSQKRSGLDDG
ncbi:MAG: hypothetical protein ND895_05845 [Pyrinomonadaceae bacterium]|nr:hypothetical protein [Pyrinomonadaceae bacterium]